ncbi:MAG: alpha/beta hydrolase [Oricola sp.]
MPSFTHDNLRLSYFDEGDPAGDPVLLIHGFASNKTINWIHPGWLETLGKAGYRVVAIDNRGHGESDKPHDTDAYTPEKMAGDAIALMRHLKIPRAHVMGYSMGARISAFMALTAPEMMRSVVFGGLGIGMVEGLGGWEGIAEALRADSIDDVTEPRLRMFRAFADQTGSDRIALAACIQSSRKKLTPQQAGTIETPALIAVGTKDDIAGSPRALAALMPNAEAVDIPGRDHMRAVGDRVFKEAVLGFFGANR